MQSSHKQGVQEEEENLFSQLLYRYLPYWPLFLFLLIVFLAGSWGYLHYAVPEYEVNASILVKDEKSGVDDQNLMEQLDLFGSKKLVENEIEVIQSRVLMREVVKDLSLYAPVTYEGSIRSLPAYVSSPIAIMVRNPDSLTERLKVYFTYDQVHQQVVIGNNRYPLNTWVNDSVNDLMFVPNANYQAPSKQKPFYYSLYSVPEVTDAILHGLKVTQATKLSSVLTMTLRDPIPKRGKDILNDLIRVYQKAAIDDKNALASNTLHFINERLGLVASELDSVEKKVRSYKTENGIIDVTAQGQLYLDNVGANDQKLSEVSVQLAVLDQVEKYVTSKNDQAGIIPSTFGVEDPELTQLLGQLYSLEIQYAGLKKTTAENNPILVSIKNQIDKMKPSILENINEHRQSLQAGKANLTGTSNQYASVLRGLPEKERGLIEISRQQTIKNGIYAFLLQKREETALSYKAAISDTRIVDDAESTVQPVSPKKPVSYLLAVIAAIALGAALIAAREIINQNIVFRKEIEQFTSVPVIGEIMHDPSGVLLPAGEGGRNVIAEQFRQLRTSLTYIGINGRKKKILVTSSVSGEGKSFIVSNLGLSLALTDKKVILLELDLRKPKLSRAFNVSREVGLTNYFVGEKEAEAIIKPTGAHPNLFIIPSGPIPPNPSELILNGRLVELLKYLESIFDYIIIDTAPVSPVTDGYIISTMTDATLYIIRHGVTPKMFIKRLDDNMKIHTLKNMAIVFNGVKNRGLGNYGYGYGYGNGYGYGYGEEKKKSIWSIGKKA